MFIDKNVREASCYGRVERVADGLKLNGSKILMYADSSIGSLYYSGHEVKFDMQAGKVSQVRGVPDIKPGDSLDMGVERFYIEVYRHELQGTQ